MCDMTDMGALKHILSMRVTRTRNSFIWTSPGIQYVRGTVSCGIRFSGSMFDLFVFTDANWAGIVLTRRSTTGNVEFAASGPLAWQSTLPTTEATSRVQSEYQAMYADMQEVVWLRMVLAEFDLWLSKPTPFFLVRQSVENLALNPAYYKRSKHIEIKYHWVREHAHQDGEFRTNEQAADIFTKAFTGTAFDMHQRRMCGEFHRGCQRFGEEASAIQEDYW